MLHVVRLSRFGGATRGGDDDENISSGGRRSASSAAALGPPRYGAVRPGGDGPGRGAGQPRRPACAQWPGHLRPDRLADVRDEPPGGRQTEPRMTWLSLA